MHWFWSESRWDHHTYLRSVIRRSYRNYRHCHWLFSDPWYCRMWGTWSFPDNQVRKRRIHATTKRCELSWWIRTCVRGVLRVDIQDPHVDRGILADLCICAHDGQPLHTSFKSWTYPSESRGAQNDENHAQKSTDGSRRGWWWRWIWKQWRRGIGETSRAKLEN